MLNAKVLSVPRRGREVSNICDLSSIKVVSCLGRGRLAPLLLPALSISNQPVSLHLNIQNLDNEFIMILTNFRIVASCI